MCKWLYSSYYLITLQSISKTPLCPYSKKDIHPIPINTTSYYLSPLPTPFCLPTSPNPYLLDKVQSLVIFKPNHSHRRYSVRRFFLFRPLPYFTTVLSNIKTDLQWSIFVSSGIPYIINDSVISLLNVEVIDMSWFN